MHAFSGSVLGTDLENFLLSNILSDQINSYGEL